MIINKTIGFLQNYFPKLMYSDYRNKIKDKLDGIFGLIFFLLLITFLIVSHLKIISLTIITSIPLIIILLITTFSKNNY
mgnify:FL=1